MFRKSVPATAPRRTGRTRAALAACIGVGLVLSACTGTSAQPDSTSFTYSLSSAPISLDMAKDFGPTTETITPLVTEPLERISTSGQLTPNVATAVKQPDPTTLVYTLRSGIKFSDGNPLTADDVAWSINHAATQPAQTAGDITAFRGVAVTGPLEVTVKLKEPDPAARGKLALITSVQEAKFAKEHATDLGARTALPVGSGPYVYSSFATNAVTLKPNKYFWGQRPTWKNMTFSFIDTDTSAQLAMRSDSIGGASVSDLKTASNWKSAGATLYASPTLQSQYLSLNTSVAPFSDVHVRKAIAYSIDRTGILSSAYGTYGNLLKGLVVPQTVANVAPSAEAATQFVGQLPQYGFDPTKAASELAQSSVPHGFTVTVPYPTSFPWSELTLLNLRQNMKKLGVTVNLKPVTQNQWLTSVFGQQNTGIQIGLAGADVPDPNGLLNGMVGRVNMGPQHFNTTSWTTPTVERALPILSTSSTSTDRWSAAKTILAQVATEVPYVPLFSPNNVVALAKGYKFTKKVDYFDMINGSWVYDLKVAS
ncbi:ABC transporter substrate-binding protein [Sciscionella marina]|uniref:ABC transporter substrate-binding protein n=1 Tax=Sciscionella marina TaxID=508770 RepID=UPI000A03EA6C|nr:ABC transporter substrate-binding protein [Sciscionella marina]